MLSGLVHPSFSSLRLSSRNFWRWSAKSKNNGEKLRVIKPEGTCSDGNERQILDPRCKVAIVVGGASDGGLSAADSLLYHGARVVVLADDDPRLGEKAAQNLCDFYGKNRARFFRCDFRSSCQLEGVFEESICKYKRVDVLFNNLDRNNTENNAARTNETQLSNTARLISTGLKYMGLGNENVTDNNGGGIIVNGTSIIGFMGWPGDPTPVYCFNKEPVAETTMDLAKIYPVEKTRVRLVALLKSQRPFAQLGLPDFPTSSTKIYSDAVSAGCRESSDESRIGKALIHVMSRASTGTTWLSEPSPCTREIPRRIHFPERQGETVDPRIYEQQNYAVALEPIGGTSSTTDCPANCEKRVRCKKFWKTRE